MRWRTMRWAWMGVVLAAGLAGTLHATASAQAAEGNAGMATTRPDGPCWTNDRRFVDCGNGTVTDQVTGLIWLKNAACLGFWDFAGAHQAAATLQAGQCGLSDNSAAGDWRLPTSDEWRRTVEGRCAGSPRSPAITDNSGTLCYLTATDGTGL